MRLAATLKEAATTGLAGAVTGGIGSIIGGGLGLLGGLFKKNNNGLKNQQKLMQQAWEYEKEGMGLQYNYGLNLIVTGKRRRTSSKYSRRRRNSTKM